MSEAVGQTMLIVGTSGVGKSNNRVNWIVRSFLADPENGAIVTNLPLDLEAIKEYYDRLFEQGRAVSSGDDVVDRVVLIPQATLDKWKVERESPWVFFGAIKHERFRVVLDEIADYYNDKKSGKWQAEWQNFLDQVRHIGDAGIELITQTPTKLPRSLRDSMEVRIDCIGCKVRRDGLFNIVYYDWYQLKAIFTGQVTLSCFNVEMVNVGGVFKKNAERKVLLDQESFRFYNSHGAVEGSKKQSKPERPPFERHGRIGTIAWFVRKNLWNLVASYGMLIVVGCVFAKYFSLGDFVSGIQPKIEAPAPAVSTAKTVTRKKRVPEAEAVPVPVSPPVDDLATATTRLIDADGAMVDGIYYELGQSVQFGRFVGSSIAEVDVGRGILTLDSGELLRMQERVSVVAEPTGDQDNGRIQSLSSATGNVSGGDRR